MNHRQSSIVAFGSTLAAAILGAAAMTGSARAEGPIDSTPPFAGSLTRAEVHAELMRNRARMTSYETEWAEYRGEPPNPASGYTRAQARADYIAAREEVQAMTSEHGGGAGYFPRRPMRPSATLAARDLQR